MAVGLRMRQLISPWMNDKRKREWKEGKGEGGREAMTTKPQ